MYVNYSQQLLAEDGTSGQLTFDKWIKENEN